MKDIAIVTNKIILPLDNWPAFVHAQSINQSINQ